MKFAVEKSELVQHIQHLAGIISTKAASPILTNYLIEADEKKGEVKITATDLKITAVVVLNAAVSDSGIIAVSASYFNSIISQMPDSVINIWQNEDLLMIQCNKIGFNILCADYTLFPQLLMPSFDNATLVNAETFNRMISKTVFAVSTDVNRPVLTGVCWKIMEKVNLMAATDGRKVAEIIVPNTAASVTESGEENIDESIFDDPYSGQLLEKIIPVKTLNFLQKIHDPAVKEMKVIFERNNIIFGYADYLVVSNIIDHNYPEYEKAFLAELPNHLILDKETLMQSIRRIALLAPEDSGRVKFDVDKDHFEISTVNKETGEAKEFIDKYEYNGVPTSISFNNKYLLSILDAIDTEQVLIKLGDSRDPIMVFNEPPLKNQKITFLLMPLRT